jgi:hypothetical protein
MPVILSVSYLKNSNGKFKFILATTIMAALTAKLFRDYFGGSWSGKITKNGEFQREIIFNWPKAFEKFSSLGTGEGLVVPSYGGVLDDTNQIAVAGWHSDTHRWVHFWHNEFGGYGEVQWTSQDVVNGITVLYGFGHESKQETDDPTDHIVMCEMIDQDNFKYTIRSFRKGVTEIVARRIRTANELNALLEKQSEKVQSFSETTLK